MTGRNLAFYNIALRPSRTVAMTVRLSASGASQRCSSQACLDRRPPRGQRPTCQPTPTAYWAFDATIVLTIVLATVAIGYFREYGAQTAEEQRMYAGSAQ